MGVIALFFIALLMPVLKHTNYQSTKVPAVDLALIMQRMDIQPYRFKVTLVFPLQNMTFLSAVESTGNRIHLVSANHSDFEFSTSTKPVVENTCQLVHVGSYLATGGGAKY